MSKRRKKGNDDHGAGRLASVLIDPETEEASLVSLLRRFSIYTDENPVTVQEREAVINGVRIRCVDERAIDVAGRSGTDDDGTMTWRIGDFICKSSRQRFKEPICFLANAHSRSPVYITTHVVQPILPQPPDDVVVNVFSWNANGDPAANVPFSWRCRVLTFVEIE